MGGQNPEWGRKGAIFGKIVVGILLFILLWIYVYHHSANGVFDTLK